MKKGQLVYFQKHGEIHSGKVVGTINDLVKVPYLDRFLYVAKDWVFETKKKAETKCSKYKLR